MLCLKPGASDHPSKLLGLSSFVCRPQKATPCNSTPTFSSPTAASTPPMRALPGQKRSPCAASASWLSARPPIWWLELRGLRTETVDLAGRLLLPGFTESHVHFIELALRATEIDVTAAAPRRTWWPRWCERERQPRLIGRPRRLRGAGWHASTWTDGVRPHRALLDAVAPNVPAALDSKDLHSIWLNTRRCARRSRHRHHRGCARRRDRARCRRGADRRAAAKTWWAWHTKPSPNWSSLKQ